MTASQWGGLTSPDPAAPALDFLEQVEALLDRLRPSLIDTRSSKVDWIRTGRLDYLEITIRHQAEPFLTCSMKVTGQGGTFYRPHTAIECYDQDADWRSELLEETEHWLTDTFTFEDTFWNDRHIRQTVTADCLIARSGKLSILGSLLPASHLRTERRLVSYGCL